MGAVRGFVPMRPIEPDRRRDRRHHVMGHARIRAAVGAARDVYGGIVDVSAGGARLRVRPGVRVERGDVYLVDLEVTVSESRGPVPPVRLSGRGQAVRVDTSSAPRGDEVALRFEAPLRIADGFVAVAPTVVEVASR
jgi:hypothetical protein